LANTNGNADRMFLSVNCIEFYQQHIPLLYPSENTDINIPLIYTRGITMGKKGIKKRKKVR
jgi:hypothetical protein